MREEGAEHDRRARPDELRERHAGERLGRLLHERGGDRGGRHCAHEQERRDDRGLSGARVGDQRVEHAPVVEQRRVHVHDGVERRRACQRFRAAEHHLGHREGVERAGQRDLGAAVRLVGERQQRQLHVEVTRIERQVVGLDDETTGGVEVVVDLRELREAAVIVERRVAAEPVLAHERRALHGHEDHRVAAHLEAALGVAGVQRECRRRLGDLLEHEVGVEPHDVVLDGLAGLAEETQRLGMVKGDPDLLEQTPPAALDRGHGVLAQHLVARHAVAEHPRSVSGQRATRARMRGQSTASRTRAAIAESRASRLSPAIPG